MFQSVQEVESYLQCHPVIARLLWNRGFREASVLESFLHPEISKLPDPFTIIDMARAVERTVAAITSRQKITVYGDYDVDGTCGASILIDFFRQIGIEVSCYQPNRFTEGYGVHSLAVEKLAQEGTELLVTVDCGITAVEPARLAQGRGVDMIILDHHKLGVELPPAFAVVNPQRPEDESGLRNLCGAGLAFFFVLGLRSVLRKKGFFENKQEPNLMRFLDLVAVATVADLVDVRGVNRILLSYGLRVLQKQPRVGLKAILTAAGITTPTTMHCGFVLGPRINAAGRLSTAQAAFELLTCTDQSFAQELAEKLEDLNRARRQAQDEVHARAREQAFVQMHDPKWTKLAEAIPAAQFGPWPRALVLVPAHGTEPWHEGVVGIVASKIVEEFGRPAFVLTEHSKEGEGGVAYKGSVRSFGQIDVLAAISAESVAKHLTNFGGHAHAGGVALKKENLENFQEALNLHMAITLDQTHYHREQRVDVEVHPHEIDEKLLIELQSLEPFGMGFPEPVFKISGVRPKSLKILKEKHIKFQVGGGKRGMIYDAVWFNAIKDEASLERVNQFKENCSLYFSPQWNEWQGNRKMQLLIRHAETSSN